MKICNMMIVTTALIDGDGDDDDNDNDNDNGITLFHLVVTSFHPVVTSFHHLAITSVG